MINCARCGKETTQEIVAGKKIKNCKTCRGLHNIKNKRVLKCEKLPAEGFYKQETINIVDGTESDAEDLTDDLEDETPKQADEPKEKDEPKQEKTIRDLLTDIFNKFDELEIASKEQINKQNELTDIVFSILNKLVANENKFNDFVLQSNLKNNVTNTGDNFNDIVNIVKQQDLKNKIVINKLDELIKAVT